MYRASAFLVMEKGIDLSNGNEAAHCISEHSIQIENGSIYLDGRDISGLIRTPEAGEAASIISSHREVRLQMVQLQREFGSTHNTVAEGRDMGTVVFPEAALKVYVVADIAIRVFRRLRDIGGDQVSQMVTSMFRRDYRDRNREESPLRLPPGALWLDGTSMTVDGQVRFVIDHYRRTKSN